MGEKHPVTGMLFLMPVVEVWDRIFVLLLELFAVYLEEMVQLMAADRIVIQVYLLKKARTQWSSRSFLY